MSETENRNQIAHNPILEAFRWWEKKRWIYNLMVAISCLIFSFPPISSFGLLEILSLLFYVLIVNICYSLGFLLEVADAYYWNGKMRFADFRMVFFILGTIGSMLLCMRLTMPSYF